MVTPLLKQNYMTSQVSCSLTLHMKLAGITGYVNYVFKTKLVMNIIIYLSVLTLVTLEGFICQGTCLLDQILILLGALCVQVILRNYSR